MAETTQARDTDTSGSYAWCHWHKGPSLTAVLIDAVEQTSGPGYGRYACAPCRQQRRLTPAAGQATPGRPS
ncbi:hypothetical protein J7I98_04515 [Streptomyces sp. ISL-98]|uniref:hypothetical protein n=1 Tax=Streptomyces sp. ISL-98 TaxID=2819192 RepID=UPI001BE7C6CE|nr:hypothetical protein [Streptomyces sp. ISL-98]MBT2505172.1 hypothetical protein [Streptomyces sp. ISL-98]